MDFHQFRVTARHINSTSMASTFCTFTSAATLACKSSRIRSGSWTAFRHTDVQLLPKWDCNCTTDADFRIVRAW